MSVVGDLDLDSYEALGRALAEAISTTESILIVNLSACGFMCSRSFGLLEGAAVVLRTWGADFIVRGCPPSFRLISTALGDRSPLAVA